MEQATRKDGAITNDSHVTLTNNNSDPAHTAEAFTSANRDIEQDPDFAPPTSNDDLDESESARLGDEGAGIA